MLKKVTRRTLGTVGLLLALAMPAAGCVETHVLPSERPMVGASTSALVGPAGADLAIADLHVIIPAGAITTETMVTVHVDDATHVPFTAYSPILRFEPAGLVLAHEAELRVPFDGDAARATAYVAGANGAYSPRPTQVFDDVAVVRMATLASTFVGTACEGASCGCEPAGMLDLLVVVDNSNSMAEEQALLQSQFGPLFQRLASGDLDGDGIQDVAAFDDIRVGITTTDLGVGTVSGISTCDPGLGDDGLLRSAPGPAADPLLCMTPSYAPPYATYSSSDPAGTSGFVAQITCEAALGQDGCGFEQQLGAALVALSPNAPTSYTAPGWTVPMFEAGRAGQGDMGNSGFLRDGSILAVLYVTDEDDCTTTDSSIFSLDDPNDLNLRCTIYSDQLMTISSMVDGLVGLRPRPEDVLVGAITGVPTGTDATDLAAVLADPSMTPTVDPANPTRLLTVCNSTNGLAFPAQRIVQSLQGAQQAGARVVLQSICEPSFDSFTSDLAHQLAARAGGEC
ncbi:MAG: hypothetical protein U0234_25540 [Sandaracinus sp.]